MKYYENRFEEYCSAVSEENFHTELNELVEHFPESMVNMGNILIYGPSGVGKYSQMLNMLKKYSPSALKYEKKVTFINDKQTYTYKISDIHYEIDMSLLGCYSRVMWHEIFQQIVDIVSIKPMKQGIIVCKNFHCIHNELLDIFYSYMQQYSSINNSQVQINFVLITEHVSFIPDSILNRSYIICVKRPLIETLKHYNDSEKKIMMCVSAENLLNLKEIKSFSLLNNEGELPIENFNTICDGIVREMIINKHIINSENSKKKSDIREFRDKIYDILIYNLDANDCVWYIFTHFVKLDYFTDSKMEEVMNDISLFSLRYGNNYRAFFHIESIIFSMICNFKV